jgi:hypothetical protein
MDLDPATPVEHPVPVGLAAQVETMRDVVTAADLSPSHSLDSIGLSLSDEECKGNILTILQRLSTDVEYVKHCLTRVHAAALDDTFRNNNSAQLTLFLVAVVLKHSSLRDTLFMWSMGCKGLTASNLAHFLHFIAQESRLI